MEKKKKPIRAFTSVLLASSLVSCSPSSAHHERPTLMPAPITQQPVENIMPFMYTLAPRPSVTPGGKIISYCGSMAVRLNSRGEGKTTLSLKPQLKEPLNNENVLLLGSITAFAKEPTDQVSTTFNLRSATPLTLDSEADSFRVEAAVNDGIAGGEQEWRHDKEQGEYATETRINICPTVIITVVNQNTIKLTTPDNWENDLPLYIASRVQPRS